MVQPTSPKMTPGLPKGTGRDFFNFEGGKEINDERIQEWIDEVYKHLYDSPKDIDARRLSSGRATVLGIKAEGCIEIFVVRNGYMECTRENIYAPTDGG